MKTKVNVDPKFLTVESSAQAPVKPKSLRPMRSMVAVRSFKPLTAVAAMVMKQEVQNEKRD